MAMVHILEADGAGNCRVLIHVPTPDGHDAEAVACRDRLSMTPIKATALVDDKVSTSEKASIAAGEVIEVPGLIPLTVVDQGSESVCKFADTLIASYMQANVSRLGHYGQTYDKKE